MKQITQFFLEGGSLNLSFHGRNILPLNYGQRY